MREALLYTGVTLCQLCFGNKGGAIGIRSHLDTKSATFNFSSEKLLYIDVGVELGYPRTAGHEKSGRRRSGSATLILDGQDE